MENGEWIVYGLSLITTDSMSIARVCDITWFAITCVTPFDIWHLDNYSEIDCSRQVLRCKILSDVIVFIFHVPKITVAVCRCCFFDKVALWAGAIRLCTPETVGSVFIPLTGWEVCIYVIQSLTSLWTVGNLVYKGRAGRETRQRCCWL